MTRQLHQNPSHSLIEIPAREFTNLPSSPPPARLTNRAETERTKAWNLRLDDAAALRNAALNAMRHRCREHVQHVTTVVQTLKEMRRLHSATRHAEMQRSLVEADHRRRQYLHKRAVEIAQLKARRARILREYSKHHTANFDATKPCAFPSPRERIERLESALQSGMSSCVHTPEVGGNKNSGTYTIQRNQQSEARLLQTQTRAAKQISLIYLLSKARRALTDAGALGSKLSSYSFSEVTACLEKEETQKAADLIFRVLGLRKPNRSRTRRDVMRERTERRILLSSLVVALHPDYVLEQKLHSSTSRKSSMDSTALFAARRMLLCLQAGTVEAIGSGWRMWKRVFLKWKKNDAQNLLDAMIEDAVAMEALRAAVGRKMSEAKQVHAISSSLGVDEAAHEASRREHAIWEEQISQKQEGLREAVAKIAGASGVKKFEASIIASRRIQDESLVHEILVDLPSLLKKVLNGPAESDVVWERLRDELSANRERFELTARLGKISKVLNNMVEGCFSLDELDVPDGMNVAIAVQVVTRAGEALKRCQAEIYDEALEEWVNSSVTKLVSSGSEFVEVIIKILQELSELVRKAQAEVVAYRIRSSVPIVRQYGVAWARSHFEGHVVSGKFSKTLPRTTDVLKETLRKLDGRGEDFKKDLLAGSGKCVKELLMRSIVRLIFKQEAQAVKDLPEILYLDTLTMRTLQNEVQKLAFLAALDNIGKQFLREKGISGCELNLEIVCSDLEEAKLRMVQETFVKLIEEKMVENGKEMSSSDTSLLHVMVEGSAQKGDRTLQLVQRRLEKCVMESVLDREVGRKKRAAVGCSRGLEVGNGLEAVASGIEVVAGRVFAVGNHLFNIHAVSIIGIVKCFNHAADL